MALALRQPRTPTIAVHTWIIMLIFCFAGSAAGSCLSYGHSCWGAHGKRSDTQDSHALHILAANVLSDGSSQNGIASSPKAQWILSRLIAGHPILSSTDKYHVRWSSLPKDKTYAPLKWKHNAALTGDESTDLIRIPINNANKDSNEREISNAQGTMHNVNEKSENEILLLSPNEYDGPINDLEKFDVLKFLSKKIGNAKSME